MQNKFINNLKTGVMLDARYKIIDYIGAGGFGIIYKAIDTNIDKVVAIKEYFPMNLVTREINGNNIRLFNEKERNEYKKGLNRFLEEARNIAKFDHENIVYVYRFFEENQTAYLVMEFLEGYTLKEMLKESGGILNIDVVKIIALKVACGLKEMHAKGIIHRDISPDNIFICNDNVVKIIDFGAARFVQEGEKSNLSIILKPGYAPPEQYINTGKQGAYTDIYALAATFYTAITGNKPPESTERIQEDAIIEPIDLIDGVSEHLNNTLMRALALKSDLRFQKDSEFIDALNEEKKVKNVKDEVRYRKNKRFLQVSIILLLILSGIYLAYDTYLNKKQMVTLDDASFVICTKATKEDQSFKNTIEEFKKQYKNVDIELMYLSDTSNFDTIVEKTEKVIVFEPYKDNIEKYGKEFSDLSELTNGNDCLFLDDIENTKFIPMSFYFPILVENISSDLKENNVLLYDEDFSDYFSNYNGSDLTAIYPELDIKKVGSKDAYQDFINGKSRFYITISFNYSAIQSNLAGLYKLHKLDKENNFSNIFIRGMALYDNGKEDSDIDMIAAKRFLSYMLSEMPQNQYFDSSAGQPVNRKTFDSYLEINSELKIYKDLIENLTVVSQ